jgi:hypothetical protein
MWTQQQRWRRGGSRYTRDGGPRRVLPPANCKSPAQQMQRKRDALAASDMLLAAQQNRSGFDSVKQRAIEPLAEGQTKTCESKPPFQQRSRAATS